MDGNLLVDVEVLLVPRDSWLLCRRLYKEHILDEACSLGKIRVSPDMTIEKFRNQLDDHLAPHLVPKEYTFTRLSGNVFTQVKPNQETKVKIQSYISKYASQETKIYLLEVNPNETLDPRVKDNQLNQEWPPPPHICHPKCIHSLQKLRDLIYQKNGEAHYHRALLMHRVLGLHKLIKQKQNEIEAKQETWYCKYSDYLQKTSKAGPLEVSCKSLQALLKRQQEKLVKQMEFWKIPLKIEDQDSKEAYHRNNIIKLHYEILELQQKAKKSKLKLDSEIKLKEQAIREAEELKKEIDFMKSLMKMYQDRKKNEKNNTKLKSKDFKSKHLT